MLRLSGLAAAWLLGRSCLAGEVIDCIAAKAGKAVITRSAIEEQARIAAFLNHQPLDLSGENLRRTAERLIDVTLIRREMEISRYAAADAGDVEKTLAGLRTKDFAASLEKYGIDEAALRRYLTLQTQTLRFVELRFRPGTSVSDGEVEQYYRDTFAPDFERRNPGKKAPELDDVRDRIEDTLQNQRIDQSMEQWLKETRAQSRVSYFPETCAIVTAVIPTARVSKRTAPARSRPGFVREANTGGSL
jgi:hypothetical protein